MTKEEEKRKDLEATAAPENTEAAVPEADTATESEDNALTAELEALRKETAEQGEKYLRLAAEYDNFRKRSLKEKDAIGQEVRAATAAAFLPVYDNLERAIQQETSDEAYKKGVEMTMSQFKQVLESLGVSEIEALGAPFDPEKHNAVMHIEDESLGENVVAEVFQTGFQCGDKVIRCAMVKVAN
ncbi:MAG: nucleotide exchange factor GrpE [Oscillospiraceae bacterium]|nr:nucleotide exchange factor GrpE [Oscillospiraceae bacterium]